MSKKKILLELAAVFVLMAILLVGCSQTTPTPTPQAALTITTTTLADGQVGTLYSQPVKATGGKGTYTWSLASGVLPGGFSLIANTGSINGKSLNAGTFNFTVQVSDGTNTATRPLSITIKPSLMPIIIDTTSLPGGEVRDCLFSYVKRFRRKRDLYLVDFRRLSSGGFKHRR